VRVIFDVGFEQRAMSNVLSVAVTINLAGKRFNGTRLEHSDTKQVTDMCIIFATHILYD
jgi:hypothetical protein